MKTICPHCAKPNDAHTDFQGGEPKHNDLSMCIGCGYVAIFDLEKKCLRAPNEKEQREIDALPQMRVMRAAWNATKKHF